MNLGQKIKKYRLLKGLTQLELGEKLGFSPKRADTRIAKYESNLMAPKSDIRNRMAAELDVDISALSDNDYSSDVEIIRALFTMQEKYGVSLDKSDNGIAFTFNSNDSKNDALLAYLYDWYDAINNYKDDVVEFEKWKGRFPLDIQSRWNQIETDVIQFYSPLVKEYKKKNKRIEYVTELIERIRSIIESGISVAGSSELYGVGRSSLVILVDTSNLLNNSNSSCVESVTAFFSSISDIESYGLNITRSVLPIKESIYLSFTIPLSPLSVLCELVNKMNSVIPVYETKSFTEQSRFDCEYNSTIECYKSMKLLEEIEFYKK